MASAGRIPYFAVSKAMIWKRKAAHCQPACPSLHGQASNSHTWPPIRAAKPQSDSQMQNLKGKNEITLLVQLFVSARKTGKFTYMTSHRLSLPQTHPCFGKLVFPKRPAHSENPGREPGATPFVNTHLGGGSPSNPPMSRLKPSQ